MIGYGWPMCNQRLGQTLAERAAGDLRVAKQLEPHVDISDGVIGFYAQQVVEKSLKSVLALGGVDFPMMEHDLDVLLTLATESGVVLPPELVDTGWLTTWATTYENAELSPGALDRRQAIEIAEAAASWLEGVIAGDTKASRSEGASEACSHRAGTLADFEAEYGPVRPPDGEG